MGAEVADTAARETSGVTTGLVLRYVRARGGAQAVTELLERAQVPCTAGELDEDSRWVSYDTRIRLFEAASTVLDDPRCTFAIGSTALRTGISHSLILVLRALGTPRQVYRQLPRSVPKFTTTSTMEVVECTATSAVLRYTLHDGYQHSRLDCSYTQGLLSAVPTIFGLPPASIVHEQCESDGAPACVYHLRWTRRSRFWQPRGRTVRADPELVALRGQLEALQSTAAELTGSEDVAEAVRRITERAGAAVLAPAHLLAVVDPDGGPPLVHSQGLSTTRTERLAGQLLRGEDLGPEAVVVDVVSSRRRHGRLAAIYPDGQQGPANEHPLLLAYAGHAAAALDLLVAMAASRRGESRSKALLGLAHELRAATDAAHIAQVVATTVPSLVGADTSSVLFWEPEAGVLRAIASDGLTDAEVALLDEHPIRPDETPELVEMLTRQQPTVLVADATTPALNGLLHALSIEGLVATPLIAEARLMGVVTAAFRPGRMPTDSAEVRERLLGVGHFAATALQNARLLSTVRHQSLHDALTGLPNRVLLAQRLEAALQGAGAGGVAVLYCDLDRFKHVNDSLGHAAGDELLRQVAERLRRVLRAGDTVGRLSGDEFALLLPSVDDVDSAATLARRVIACFDEPFRIDGRERRVTASVGVAVHRGPGGAVQALLDAADTAMYGAKQSGRNQIAVAASSSERREATTCPSLAAELRTALATSSLTGPAPALRLFYQPIVSIGDTDDAHEVVGVEALVRWQHPRLGLLPPAAFLPIAEEEGLITELDLWAIGAACGAVAGSARPASHPLDVAVNLSSSTLVDPRLYDAVRCALASSGLAPERLHLEIVESRALVDLPGVVDRLIALRQLGVRIVLDDFGTGYSTLTWLHRLPVDLLKIDRSFTADLPDDPASLSAVRGALALAEEFDIDVVAEGVETLEQLSTLRGLGCAFAQGYLLGRPAAALPQGGRTSASSDVGTGRPDGHATGPQPGRHQPGRRAPGLAPPGPREAVDGAQVTTS